MATAQSDELYSSESLPRKADPILVPALCSLWSQLQENHFRGFLPEVRNADGEGFDGRQRLCRRCQADCSDSGWTECRRWRGPLLQWQGRPKGPRA